MLQKTLEIKWIDDLKCKVSRINLLVEMIRAFLVQHIQILSESLFFFSDYTLPTTNSMLRQNCFVEEETGVGIDEEQVSAWR